MKIDLHTHTSPASSCSRISHEEYVDFCRHENLEAIALTNHGEVSDNRVLAPRLAAIGVTLLHGVEISTTLGDFVVFSPDLDFLDTLKPVQTPLRPETIPGHAAVVWVHPAAGGGMSGAAYLPGAETLLGGAVHAVELYNGSWPGAQYVDEARRIAERLGVPLTGGSDAHSVERLMTCFTEVEAPIEDTADLVAALRHGHVRPQRPQTRRRLLARRRPSGPAST